MIEDKLLVKNLFTIITAYREQILRLCSETGCYLLNDFQAGCNECPLKDDKDFDKAIELIKASWDGKNKIDYAVYWSLLSDKERKRILKANSLEERLSVFDFKYLPQTAREMLNKLEE